MTIQQIGVSHGGLFERQDDVSSVAYWYQTEPHSPFPQLPEKERRWPRQAALKTQEEDVPATSGN